MTLDERLRAVVSTPDGRKEIRMGLGDQEYHNWLIAGVWTSWKDVILALLAYAEELEDDIDRLKTSEDEAKEFRA